MSASVRLWLASLIVLGTSMGLVSATEPSVSTVPHASIYNGASHSNQQLADSVANRLRASQLQHFRVDITTQSGIVYLNGSVADARQFRQVIDITQGVSGVRSVVPRLYIRETQIRPIQAILQPKDLLPGPPPDVDPKAGNEPPAPLDPTPLFQGPLPDKVPNGKGPGGAPGPNPNTYDPPRMPPYAWPTYAPYNNYSRVAYPKLYPYNAFPYIGPTYPFPKIPLGWRSVTLSWEDGFWYLGRNATGHDYWRLRFW